MTWVFCFDWLFSCFIFLNHILSMQPNLNTKTSCLDLPGAGIASMHNHSPVFLSLFLSFFACLLYVILTKMVRKFNLWGSICIFSLRTQNVDWYKLETLHVVDELSQAILKFRENSIFSLYKSRFCHQKHSQNTPPPAKAPTKCTLNVFINVRHSSSLILVPLSFVHKSKTLTFHLCQKDVKNLSKLPSLTPLLAPFLLSCLSFFLPAPHPHLPWYSNCSLTIYIWVAFVE